MASARTGHDVVKRHLGRRERVPAELARIAVAQQNVLPGKRPALLGDMPVSEQADY
jgi:hypothetical protein